MFSPLSGRLPAFLPTKICGHQHGISRHPLNLPMKVSRSPSKFKDYLRRKAPGFWVPDRMITCAHPSPLLPHDRSRVEWHLVRISRGVFTVAWCERRLGMVNLLVPLSCEPFLRTTPQLLGDFGALTNCDSNGSNLSTG